MYTKILVPIDGSASAERGLAEAISLAGITRAGLVILHVVDAYPLASNVLRAQDFEALRDMLRRTGHKLLADAAFEATRGNVPATLLLREIEVDRVADCIEQVALESGCDLIVMGTHGRNGLDRFFMGSNAELVLRNSRTPVLLVRTQPRTPTRSRPSPRTVSHTRAALLA